jgi:hypothetical protein
MREYARFIVAFVAAFLLFGVARAEEPPALEPR